MPFLITMPKLSPTMSEGTIVKWHKKEGDKVKEGDLLIEVATDKATVEYQALDGGYLRKILLQVGEEGAVNAPLAIMTVTQDESISDFQMPTEAPPLQDAPAPLPSAKKGEKTASLVGVGFEAEPPLKNYEFEFELDKEVIASPYAKKLALEQGLDLSSVKGTGPSGRIVSRDLEMAQKGPITFGQNKHPTLPPGTYENEKLTPMRKAIGEKLQASKTFIPHFYIDQEVNVESLVRLRAELLEGGVKVTYNDFVLRAVALALKEHPRVNSGFDSVRGEIIRFKTVDVALAVGLPDGLITPIIRHADYKNLGQLSVEVRHLAKCAKEGTLSPEQYKGGSFTLSNLGMYGVTGFAAIINPPQAAILAVGGIREVVALKNGLPYASQRMNMTLSADHRVIDGADGAKFIMKVKEWLENPATLLI